MLALTDNTGAIKTEYAHSPYGEVSFTGEANANPFQYTGRENDGTGLYYYRARYYDPLTSRFVAEDPIGFEGGINTYGYVENNPLIYIDPKGLYGYERPGSEGFCDIGNCWHRPGPSYPPKTCEQQCQDARLKCKLGWGLGLGVPIGLASARGGAGGIIIGIPAGIGTAIVIDEMCDRGAEKCMKDCAPKCPS